MSGDVLLGVVRAVRGSKRCELLLDGQHWRYASAAAVRALSLRDGERVAAEVVESQLAAIEPRLARERAYRLLAARERTESELRRRLTEDGYPEDLATETVGALCEVGLVDDDRFASAMAHALIEVRGLGRARAARELALHGVDPELARRSIDAVASPEQDAQRAVTIAARLRRPADTVPKLAARLVRRGFAPSIAVSAARDALPDMPGDVPSDD